MASRLNPPGNVYWTAEDKHFLSQVEGNIELQNMIFEKEQGDYQILYRILDEDEVVAMKVMLMVQILLSDRIRTRASTSKFTPLTAVEVYDRERQDFVFGRVLARRGWDVWEREVGIARQRGVGRLVVFAGEMPFDLGHEQSTLSMEGRRQRCRENSRRILRKCRRSRCSGPTCADSANRDLLLFPCMS
eukprot:768804-Hanusia_phi.AAC.5